MLQDILVLLEQRLGESHILVYDRDVEDILANVRLHVILVSNPVLGFLPLENLLRDGDVVAAL